LQSNLSEAQFTERLTDFSLGFRGTGIWDNNAAKNAMADWAAMANLASIRNYILSWGLSSVVPDFEKYIRAYWYANYGIDKVCDASSENTTVNSNKGVEFICRDNFWSLGSKYSETDRDTFGWGSVCSVSGEIRQGNVSDKKYICKNSSWNVASDYELDVGGLGNCSTEGVLKDGLVSGKKYVCEGSSWKLASVDVGLGACTAANQGMTANNGADYYTCDSNVWRKATEYERDVGGLGNCSTEGVIKDGQVSGTRYACKNKVWVIATKCLESKSCLTFTDSRDGQSYFYVKIGEQTWMAENLNYNATGSKCYNDEPAKCAMYGRLYNWATAMAIDAKYNSEIWDGSDVKHKGICPSGWHIPSDAEWYALMAAAGGVSTAGTKLKATGGWNDYQGKSGNGTDDHGFSALPSGNGNSSGSFGYVGSRGLWWSATESDASFTHIRYMDYNYASVLSGYGDKAAGLFSVRCVKD